MNLAGEPFIHDVNRAGRGLRETHVFLCRDASGGARRDRTDDLMLAKHALYQLSYGPNRERVVGDPAVQDGRPGQTRTADLTLIRRTL